MVNPNLLTTSPNDVIPVELSWEELAKDINIVFDMLAAGTFYWYGDELAFLNAILIENGITYC